MACECGCGFEGEDDVTQYCIEEAAMLTLELAQQAADTPEPEPAKPGEITDPEMQEAMAIAKRVHAETYGVQV